MDKTSGIDPREPAAILRALDEFQNAALTAHTDLSDHRPMELQLPKRQAAGLVGLAARSGRTTDELVVEAVDRLLADEKWFEDQVKLGIDQIARGEFVEESEMDKRVARILGH